MGVTMACFSCLAEVLQATNAGVRKPVYNAYKAEPHQELAAVWQLYGPFYLSPIQEHKSS